MKKLAAYALIACLTGCLTACNGMTAAHQGRNDAYRADVSQDESARRILIAFGDRSIGRAPLGDAVSTYRNRGQGYLTSTFSSHLVDELADQYRLKRVSDWPISTLGMHCVVFEIAAGDSVDGVIKAVEKDSRVRLVQSLQRFHVLGGDPYVKLQPALDSMRVRDAHHWTTGQGVTIAIVDTGVDVDHPDLHGQIVDNVDVVDESTAGGGVKSDIHGTAVAGVIAAIANNNEGIVGVAPNAKLLTYRACWQQQAAAPDSTCDTYTLAKAINNAIVKRPQVLNLSLGGPRDPLLEMLVKKALEQGTVVVAAAAEGSQHEEAGFPASVEGVITVHAAGTSEAGKTTLSANSLSAPGIRVLTTFPQRSYNFISGNSFAAAHVSGAVALLIALKPGLTLSKLTEILQSSSEAVVKVGGVNSPTAHQINVSAAVRCVKAGGTCSALHARS